MEIMHTYSDLLTEIEIIKEEIKLTEQELQYWFGIDLDKGTGIPLSGSGSKKYGTNVALIQTDKKTARLSKLKKRLKELEYAKVRIDMFMEKLEGLDYKIAYYRIVENMTHKEIAKELGYTEQYIRERWAKTKTYKKPTKTVANS